jgi:hypothetical protein
MNRFECIWFAALVAMSAAVSAEPVTWAKNVFPIVQERCLECHRPNQVAPFSLTSFDQARPWAKSIKQQVVARTMPPYPGEPGAVPFHGDMNLTQEEIDTFAAWVDQGARFGNEADLPPAKEFKTYEGGWRLGEPDIVLQPEEPFTVKADVTDLYQCFLIPFDLAYDVWLKGVEFQPGNTEVAHHFILFEDMGGTFPALDAETPEPGCECANMDKIVGARIVKMWAPGNVSPLRPAGIGNKLTAGKNLILQAHYYNATGIDQVDRSRIALHVAQPDETIDKQVRLQLVSQMLLDIPAGAPHVEHEMTIQAMKDMTLYSVGGHMHLRGKSIGQWAVLPDSSEEIVLLSIPEYDFDWQLDYLFAKPWKAPKGTKFIMRSVHDNSADNPNNPDPTIDVKWGLFSADEMAFTGHYFTYDDEELGITPEPIRPEDVARLHEPLVSD